MAEPLRHRQTKEAATDMFSLQPPRYIPTLPTPSVTHIRAARKLSGDELPDIAKLESFRYRMLTALRQWRVVTEEDDPKLP